VNMVADASRREQAGSPLATASASSRRRVLHVVLDLNEGGLERVVTDLVQDSVGRKWEASVLCLRSPGRLADELPSDTLYRGPVGAGTALYYPRVIASLIGTIAPDVLHLHSGVWLKGAYAGRLARVPRILFTDHGRSGDEPLSHRVADRLGATATDAVVAVSDALAHYLMARLRVPARKLRVIPNGIRISGRPEAGTRDAVRTELGLPLGVPIVGTVGRLDPIKAIDHLIDAVALLRSRWPGNALPVLLIVGDGPERAALETRVEKVGLRGAVVFTGWRRDAPRLMEAMDSFVLSSDSEGTSIALLEAMAAERAVVATNVGGTPAVLGHVLSGQLVAPRDLESIVQLIEQTLRDDGRREELGKAARRRVLESYTVRAMADAYMALYDDLTDASPKPGHAEGHNERPRDA
jgi:glycosyltransferase involved in cell wall biosynthesis